MNADDIFFRDDLRVILGLPPIGAHTAVRPIDPESDLARALRRAPPRRAETARPKLRIVEPGEAAADLGVEGEQP